MELELKELVSHANMAELMDKAFSDLRADYELGIDVSREKIEELKQTNVDVDNHLQNLISYSTSSSGIVSGLRGTGKTHLMLLARDAINVKYLNDPSIGAFCVYLNIKRLTVPHSCNNEEIFNRVFSIFLYDEFSLQLKAELECLKEIPLTEKFLRLFSGDKRKMAINLEEAIRKLLEFKSIIKIGTDELRGLSAGTISEEDYEADLLSLASAIEQSCGLSGAQFKSTLSVSASKEISNKILQSKDTVAYLSCNTVRTQLLTVMKLLGMKSLTFYIDEWEKMYPTRDLQKYVATYINHIIDNPLYFWLGVVPNRGSVAPLTIGADLQHTINLDESLIYENSSSDRSKCIDYFTQFINKRLSYFFRDTPYAGIISEYTLFNKVHNLELLVLASMGNSRDFGTMLSKCWSEFQSYRNAGQYAGRPFKYISEAMVIKSIQYSGNQKRLNIPDDSNSKAVWEDIEMFCISKRSSHFVVEESPECNTCLARPEFSDLMYNRLIHFRRAHLTQKDSEKEQRLSLYALDYASIYDLHAGQKRLVFITDYNEIHDSVRRYIYNPQGIIKKLQIQNGEVVLCKSCGNKIDIKKMKPIWEKNFCPYCGGKIHD
mgnify:CR=1 FL=1|jgi:DNA-directed RNA polymerase subunit RPC12/RpoP